MSEQNESELRQLDCWIAEHVMGWQNDVEGSGHYYEETLCGIPKAICYHEWTPTTSPADAMKVLSRCIDFGNSLFPPISIVLWKDDGAFWIDAQGWESDDRSIELSAETLELAICLFAKKLFS